jgi:hypothetical protein
MAQVVDHLLSKCKALSLSSIPSSVGEKKYTQSQKNDFILYCYFNKKRETAAYTEIKEPRVVEQCRKKNV